MFPCGGGVGGCVLPSVFSGQTLQQPDYCSGIMLPDNQALLAAVLVPQC